MLITYAVLAAEVQASDSPPRQNLVIEVTGQEHRSQFDWDTKGPLDLIHHLRSTYQKDPSTVFYIGDYHCGWITREDLPKLELLAKSNEPCAKLIDPVGTVLGVTVGEVATKMLESYREWTFPPWNKVKKPKKITPAQAPNP